MIRLFRDLKIEYYITELFGIIILLASNVYIYGETGNIEIYSIIVLITLIFTWIVSRIFTKVALKRMIELSNKAAGNTDLEDTVKPYRRLLLRAKNKKIKTHIITNLGTIYIKLGNTKKALKLYEDFKPSFDKKESGVLNKIIYLQNLCKVLINEKVYDLAKENLGIIKRLKDDKKLSSYAKEKAEVIYNDLVVELTLKENKERNYKKIEEYYLKRFNEEENEINKIFISFQLSKIYSKLKKRKDEKKYKKYYEDNRKDIQYN